MSGHRQFCVSEFSVCLSTVSSVFVSSQCVCPPSVLFVSAQRAVCRLDAGMLCLSTVSPVCLSTVSSCVSVHRQFCVVCPP